MQYGSLFSGMGGIDLACDRAGMACGFQAEMNEACGKVLGHHWPGVQRFQDVRDVTTAATDVRPGLIAGGFPCQDVSVAGRRAGLAGERTGLFWEFVRILGEFRPRWVLLENVPGLLSSNGWRDMGAVLWALGKLGYGWSYRVLDAQWCGVPQRRRRVFIVGCFGDVRRAAEILFECESLPWDSPPSREAGARIAAAVTSGTSAGSGVNPPGRRREDDVNIVSHTLRAEGFDASEDGTGRGVPIIPIDMRQASRGGTFTNNRQEGSSGGAPGTGIGEAGDPCPTLAGTHMPAIGFSMSSHPLGSENLCEPITTRHGDPGCVAARYSSKGNSNDRETVTRMGKAKLSKASKETQVPGTVRADRTRAAPIVFAQNQRDEVRTMDIAGALAAEPGMKQTTYVAYPRSPAVAIRTAQTGANGHGFADEVSHTLDGASQAVAAPFTFQTRIARNGRGQPDEVAGALTSCEGGTHADSKPHVADQYGVRRLMPIECLRLQGFPDTWLDDLGLSDSAKYRMISNAVAIPVVEWIAKRIALNP